MDVNLYLAIKNSNYLKVVELLRDFKLRDNEYFSNKITYLSLAILNGNLNIAEELIKHGADVNKLSYVNHDWPKESRAFTSLEPCLVTATRYGNVHLVRWLLRKNAIVDKTDSFSMSALHWAASLDLSRIADLLIKSGANQNLLDLNNQAPLEKAIKNGHVKIVDIFVENYILQARYREILLAAIQENQPEILKLLLKQLESGQVEFDLNSLDNTVGTLLHYAVILSNIKASAASKNEKTSPVPVSNMVKNVQTISILIESGSEINKCNKFNETPLHMCRNVYAVRLLLERGARMHFCDITGKMPLFNFICRANYDICAEMLKSGCDLDNIDRFGNSLLYVLLHSNAPAYLIKLLLEAGVSLKNEKWLAKKEYPKRLCPKMVKLIEYRMANPPSLKELARKSLRMHLRNSNCNKSIVSSVAKLTTELPQCLQDYILLNATRYEHLFMK